MANNQLPELGCPCYPTGPVIKQVIKQVTQVKQYRYLIVLSLVLHFFILHINKKCELLLK